jgi:ketosteroid isomerase-like protein
MWLTMIPGPADIVERLFDATNAHDLDAIVDCFAEGYRNDTPVHPRRSFDGRAQVRSNWEQILAAVPDITASVTASAVQGDVVWSEWEMRGSRRDGAHHLMRGVIIFGVHGGQAAWARFFLEPVDSDDDDATAAVRQIVGASLATTTEPIR